jgi:hypothetical protein
MRHNQPEYITISAFPVEEKEEPQAEEIIHKLRNDSI